MSEGTSVRACGSARGLGIADDGDGIRGESLTTPLLVRAWPCRYTCTIPVWYTCRCVCKPGFMKLMYPPVRHFRTLDALFSSAFWKRPSTDKTNRSRKTNVQNGSKFASDGRHNHYRTNQYGHMAIASRYLVTHTTKMPKW